jgi:hypothetical protein
MQFGRRWLDPGAISHQAPVRRRASAIALMAAALAALALAAALAGPARGERKQRGEVIVSLDGGISPLRLPRHRPAPVALRLEGGLRSADGSLLPRVTRVEIALPSQGVVSTAGLPSCPPRRLRHAKPPAALAACRPALVGRGSLEAKVLLPGQGPFTIHARLLLFNGRAPGGRRAVLLHGYARTPPIVVVLPFVLRRRPGRFGTALVGRLPPALGPWPRLARFELTLNRRYRYRGRPRSFLSASCPIPPRFTAGFFSLARSTYKLVGGHSLTVEIARGCRGL